MVWLTMAGNGSPFVGSLVPASLPYISFVPSSVTATAAGNHASGEL